jgi:carbonic anhydrase
VAGLLLMRSVRLVSAHLLGTREIGVLHHTNCGLEGLTDDEVARKTGVSGFEFLTFRDLEESVREDVAIIRRCDLLPKGLVAWGAVYDVATGAIRVVADPQLD